MGPSIPKCVTDMPKLNREEVRVRSATSQLQVNEYQVIVPVMITEQYRELQLGLHTQGHTHHPRI